MSRHGRPANRSAMAGAAAVLLAFGGLAACGRSGSTPSGGTSSGASGSLPSSAGQSANAGSFGSLKAVCGPGNAKGTTARGVTDTTITVATFSDAGNTIQPGLEKEFFDASDAFAKWCNAAGGINGRKVVIHKHDAKLFNSAAAVIDACRTDFMDVGGGMALDDATVKPRVACGLGAIPAYRVSPGAVQAPLQVLVVGAPATEAYVGPFEALARQEPSVKAHTGIWTNNLAAIQPQAKRTQLGLKQVGFTVNDFQAFSQNVPNWRPYLSVSQQAGTELIGITGAPNYAPLFSAFQDVGYHPKALLFTPDVYKSAVADAYRSANGVPPSYLYSNFLPFEMADSNPVAKQAVDLLTTTASRQSLSAFSQWSLSAWLLWAQSATECGSNLTVNCVLSKAGNHPAWDAGGFGAPVDTTPGKTGYSDCLLMMQMTKNGFVYDKSLTNPNQGVFYCDSKNVVSGLPSSP